MIGLGLGLSRYRATQSVAGFSPSSLFSSGEVGVWYDPSDLSTMFTDTAGTTQASVGQAVARINDKSGNGINATQATASKRPILRQSGSLYYLEFDGVDDALVTGSVIPGINSAQAFLGMKHDSATTCIVIESSATIDANNGAIRITAANTGAIGAGSRGTTQRAIITSALGTPHTSVVSLIANISQPLVQLNRNGSIAISSALTQGTGNYLEYPIYIGARGGTSFPFDGSIFGICVRFGADLDSEDISQVESWMNEKTGAY